MAEESKCFNGYAFHLDTEKEEREKGFTIQSNTAELFTDTYHYTVTDAPGRDKYIYNMITGAVAADVALLMVPARGWELALTDEGGELGGIGHAERERSRTHAELLRSLGVTQLIVGINQMDDIMWDEAKFEEIKGQCQRLLKHIGFRREIPFIPYLVFLVTTS